MKMKIYTQQFKIDMKYSMTYLKKKMQAHKPFKFL